MKTNSCTVLENALVKAIKPRGRKARRMVKIKADLPEDITEIALTFAQARKLATALGMVADGWQRGITV
jgi:hypothetical protein